MIRLLTDENFDNNILGGLIRRLPQLDVVSVKQAGLAGKPDIFLLRWAAKENRTILTHDKKTMTKYANELLAQGEPMAGVLFVPNSLPIGRAINDLEIALECYSEWEIRNSTLHLPL